jgi:transposase
MAYRYGERRQQQLFPPSLEEYVPVDAPVRAYDAFVDALDLPGLGIALEPGKVGSPQYDPRAMLKLLLYGYSYGLRSSRKLERECHYNVAFMWLMGGLRPDHKTIAEFRRRHKEALAAVLKQCARLCIKLDLIEGNTLFVDGSKVRANAGFKNTWDARRGEKRLAQLDKRIAEILCECEAVDQGEADQGSLVKMSEELADQQVLRSQVKQILAQLDAESKTALNTTDNDAVKVHGRQGAHVGYNLQNVVDEKHGLIVSTDVVNESNDIHQFAAQIEQAQETLGQPCQTACADCGYSDIDELEKVDAQDINVVVPTQRQASKKEAGPFDVSRFTYDRERDGFVCPTGQVLKYRDTDVQKGRKVYQAGGAVCRQCPHLGVCTSSNTGRKVTRLLKEDLREKLRQQYLAPANQQIYRLRKQKAELPFGHMKHNLHFGQFGLRGLEGVKAEASLAASCFNIARMITILGVAGLVTGLMA